MTFPNPDEIERHLEKSRRLRAEAAADMLKSAGRSLGRSYRRLTSALVSSPRHQQQG